MTAKRIYLLIGISVVVFLIARLAFQFKNKMEQLDKEREWYAAQLNYDFSSRIDSIAFVRGEAGVGRVYCTITRGDPDDTIELALNRKLQYFSSLRFNESKEPNSVWFILPGAERYNPGDSVIVNSATNDVRFYRNQVQVYADKLSNLLEARVLSSAI